MKRTALLLRCVPRFGYANTEVRTIDLDLALDATEEQITEAAELYFAARGIHGALYAIEVDNNGYFAVINDEAYEAQWGTALL